MSETIFRWRLDCGGEGYWTLPMTEDEAHQLADKVYPPPAVVRLSRRNGPRWERQGGEFADGGGRVAIEWSIVAEETLP